MIRRDPIFHSEHSDELRADHPLANETVMCDQCGEMVHACNNECMQSWLEFNRKNICVQCFESDYRGDWYDECESNPHDKLEIAVEALEKCSLAVWHEDAKGNRISSIDIAQEALEKIKND